MESTSSTSPSPQSVLVIDPHEEIPKEKIPRFKKIIIDAWGFSETCLFIITAVVSCAYLIISYENYQAKSKNLQNKVTSSSPSDILLDGVSAMAVVAIVGLVMSILSNLSEFLYEKYFLTSKK